MQDGLTSLGSGLAQSIGVGAGTWVLAKFLDAVGLGKFADALFPLNHIIDQLNAIAAQVTAVKTLVEEGIQATEQSQYNELVANVAPIDGDISALWDRMRYEASMSKDDPTLQKYNADLVGDIGTQLVENHSVLEDLNKALAPTTPATYGILQAASAYLGSRKPFFTQASSRTMQAVFDYYQVMQLRLSILLTNYYSTRPDTFSPTTIKVTVIDRITTNIADQRTLLKPPLPPGTFIDLRTDKNPTLLLWGPVSWVNGGALEHYCVDQQGVRHRFFYNVDQLTCDPGPPSLKNELATEDQFKALLDGWEGKTPLEWLRKETGLEMTAAPAGTDPKHDRVLLGRATRDPGQPRRSRGGPVLQVHLSRRQHDWLLRVHPPVRHAGHEHAVPRRVDDEPVRPRPVELQRQRRASPHAGEQGRILLASRRRIADQPEADGPRPSESTAAGAPVAVPDTGSCAVTGAPDHRMAQSRLLRPSRWRLCASVVDDRDADDHESDADRRDARQRPAHRLERGPAPGDGLVVVSVPAKSGRSP